jgi:hypothetical protein
MREIHTLFGFYLLPEPNPNPMPKIRPNNVIVEGEEKDLISRYI